MEESGAPSSVLVARHRRRAVAGSRPLRRARRALTGVGLVGLVALLVPGTAVADKISDAQAECRSKAEGDACSVYGDRGACVERTLERPNGLTKRWLECDPGKRPKRRPKPADERTIDAAGPAGVLPALTTGDGSSTGDADATSSTGGEAEGEAEAPTEVAPTTAAPTETSGGAAEAAVHDARARVDRLLEGRGEGAGGCSIAPTPSRGPALAGLLVALLGLRRRR